jgi:DNA topoisomerase-1
MKKYLVIVESPAKAKTLGKILGRSYAIKASMGHVRDLPKSNLGVDIEHDFTPKYVVPRLKNKTVQELKQAGKDASTIYLATDPDREGEAIAWHLKEVIKSKKAVYYRVAFHEITEEAIKQAFKHPRDIDAQLVNAQQARRILDRLVGYKISPLLWAKVRRGLSAGRVQSVALKIIVDREREISQFVAVEYWSIEVELSRDNRTKDSPFFRAFLVSHLDNTKLELHNEIEASEVKQTLERAIYSVLKVKNKEVLRQPAPPFITSTLQQEAWRKLHFSAKQTMAVAQQLYEGLPVGEEGNIGLITYMRTDSTHVTRSAVIEAREYSEGRYGNEYVPTHARTFISKVKGAQEAHEAIRPTKIKREPLSTKPYLTVPQYKLYDLIWKRMVASQMAPARLDNTTVDIKATSAGVKNRYLLRATDSVVRFPGFTVLYTEGQDEAEEEAKKRSPLPELAKDEPLCFIAIYPRQHFTQPPPRFTEASLIKILEQWGIGRPSTYAPIISTLQDREYIRKQQGSLPPTDLGMVINDLLNQYFASIIAVDFTAHMETELDKVAEENKDWVGVIREFYAPFESMVSHAVNNMEKMRPPEEATGENCPNCGKPIVVKYGRYGKFHACSGYPECKFTQPFQKKIGVRCPECSSEMVEKISKTNRVFYGCSAYPQCKCTFSGYMRPMAEPCPRCGSLLTVYRKVWKKCTKCDYKGKLEKVDALSPETKSQ